MLSDFFLNNHVDICNLHCFLSLFFFFKNLVVANGGLGNGMSRNQLLSVLEECGLVEALLMPPNKPYSFVRYKSAEESRNAYVTLNGKEILDDLGQKIILYLNFVEKGIVTPISF